MKTDELVAYLDAFLRTTEIADGSRNGLQVRGPDEARTVAFAVDVCMEAIVAARDADADMLIVHHGLFWDEPLLLVGPHFRRVKALLDAGIALYASHLPLDVHEDVGNNVELARLLGLRVAGRFGDFNGLPLGVVAQPESPLSFDALARRYAERLGDPVRALPFGPTQVEAVAIVSGGAPWGVAQAAEVGIGTYLTGEMGHRVYHDAKERGVNVLFGGHYLTETVGLKALARHLAERFDITTLFLDVPTGA